MSDMDTELDRLSALLFAYYRSRFGRLCKAATYESYADTVRDAARSNPPVIRRAAREMWGELMAERMLPDGESIEDFVRRAVVCLEGAYDGSRR